MHDGRFRSAPELQELEAQLEARCEAAGVIATEDFDGPNDDDETVNYYGWTVYHRDAPQWCAQLRTDEVEKFGTSKHVGGLRYALSSRFEHYRYLGKYDGVWSRLDSVVEVEVHFPTWSGRLDIVEKVAMDLGLLTSGQGVESFLDIVVPLRTTSEVTVELARGCRELQIWRTASPAMHKIVFGHGPSVLRIRAKDIPSSLDAIKLVESYGLAALLTLESSVGIPGQLSVPNPVMLRLGRRVRRTVSQLQTLTLAPPIEATLLYLHAQGHKGDAVMRFLGLYHVLEYFFPRRFYEAEANLVAKRLRGGGAESTSNLTHEAILKVLSSQSGGRGLGNEREQLLATINHVFTAKELRQLLSTNETLNRFYRQEEMPLVQQQVRVEQKEQDLRVDVANRLYDLRCRIVHKKESASESVLLPFSQEVAHLHEDVEVVEILARRLLERESALLPQ